MKFRLYFSFILMSVATILVFLPSNAYRKNQPQPYQQLELSGNDSLEVSIDQAARYVNNNDSTVQFIDLRTREEFSDFNIPGSINIPYEELFNEDWQGYLNPAEKTNVLYSNGNSKSDLSLALLTSKGYQNNKVLNGGLNKWFEVVMNSGFEGGGRISARENAMYENRRRARDLFIKLNSLPDSLKKVFLKAKILEEERLDGGC